MNLVFRLAVDLAGLVLAARNRLLARGGTLLGLSMLGRLGRLAPARRPARLRLSAMILLLGFLLNGSVIAQDIPLVERQKPFLMFTVNHGPSQSGPWQLDWDTACQLARPPPCGPTDDVCYSGGRGGFNPPFGAGCFYTVTIRNPPSTYTFFGQNWATPAMVWARRRLVWNATVSF
jgi:hypothetical protein